MRFLNKPLTSLLIPVLLLSTLVFPGCSLFRSSLKKQLLAIEMVPITGGTFVMGDFHNAANQDALPAHPVTIEDFKLSRYEVTYAQYDAFALATGRPLPEDDGYTRDDRAVANVTWDDAVAFCESYGYRLPSEAEWEYAAREGGKDLLYAGTNDTALLGDYARYRENSVGYSSTVGRKKPNSLGLYDMSGNIAEWVGAFYQFYPEPEEQPTWNDMEISGIRIVRGGYFHHEEEILRTYWRTGTLHDVSTFSIGFRCAQ